MKIRRLIGAAAILFNIASVVSLAPLLSQPDAALWLRNAIFIRPRKLAELSEAVSEAPRRETRSKPPMADLAVIEKVQAICVDREPDCAPKTLAAMLSTLKRRGGCGTYQTQAELVSGVLKGGGCCSDIVKAFLLLARQLGFAAREVHIPNHTTAEFWDEASQRWIWIDPFIGYQAFYAGQPLSHLEVYKNFYAGRSVQFSLIDSPWPIPVPPSANYAGYRPAFYQAIFYTPQDSLERSGRLGDWLGGTPLPKAVREAILYLTVKPPLLASATGFNYFLLVMARAASMAWLLAWLSSTLVLLTIEFSRLQRPHKGSSRAQIPLSAADDQLHG
jgi:hypothetical protein